MKKIDQQELHTFIGGLIGTNSVLVDCGANTGNFSVYMRNKYGSTVYAIEPVPELFRALPKDEKIFNTEGAIADKSGEVELFLPKDRCATLVRGKDAGKGIKVKAYSFADFMRLHGLGKIDLLKMDIEGAEIPLLESFNKDDMSKLLQLTVEFHDFLYPELKPKVEEIMKKFRSAGFYCIPFSVTNNGDVLFVRRDLISYPVYLWLKYAVKYIRGFWRKMKEVSKKNS